VLLLLTVPAVLAVSSSTLLPLTVVEADSVSATPTAVPVLVRSVAEKGYTQRFTRFGTT
jgi:hypothetical protein